MIQPLDLLRKLSHHEDAVNSNDNFGVDIL